MAEPTQMDFDLSTKPDPDTHPRLPELMAVLDAAGGWVKAQALRAAGFNDRELREIQASDMRGEILSFPGSAGYKLWKKATIEEIERAEALISQGRKMIRRGLIYRRRRHGQIR